MGIWSYVPSGRAARPNVAGAAHLEQSALLQKGAAAVQVETEPPEAVSPAVLSLTCPDTQGVLVEGAVQRSAARQQRRGAA